MRSNEFAIVFLDGGAHATQFGRLATSQTIRVANAVGVSNLNKESVPRIVTF
jgi:hypothetical protein